MTPAKELPIVIEKSQEEIEQIIALVHSSNLPEGTKPFVIGCKPRSNRKSFLYLNKLNGNILFRE
ncbi:TPA: hypothetical protein F8R78_07780 [Legionella pneumophila]|nr:hypothetical protein DI110_12265 [Legionella pneumophila]HAT8773727.1 hypothetical protein [Legionella pneumophila]HAU1061149.1 hypothetical protein [Legionella pneumophila]HAU1232816.1 hypothetical protein [Legionella pneumophila]HAU1368038.1 hypothetical protein [Legionella pneumophila]